MVALGMEKFKKVIVLLSTGTKEKKSKQTFIILTKTNTTCFCDSLEIKWFVNGKRKGTGAG